MQSRLQSRSEDTARQDGAESRLKLNTIQVAAGALAAISSAVAASYLSVGGTIIGAAIGSVVTTTAGAIYSYYLERTRSRLRQVVTPVLDRTGIARVVVAEEQSRPQAGDPGAPDLEQPAASDRAAVREEQPGATASGTGAEAAAAGAGYAGSAGSAGSGKPAWEISWRRLAPLGGIAILIFAIAMGSITLFESATGRPVSATVRNDDGSGARTSLDAAFGNDSKSDQQDEQEPGGTPGDESSSPSGEPTDEASPEPGQGESTSPAPEPSSTEEPQPTDQPTQESTEQSVTPQSNTG